MTAGALATFASLAELTAAVPETARRGLVEGALGVQIHGAISPDRASAWVARVHAAQADHTQAFGSQASLGIAWYTHLEEGRAREYFAGAAASDARVRRHLPGFQRALVDLVGSALGLQLTARPGHAGPGIHVFEPGGLCARVGGEIHSDTEGLPGPYARARRPAYTAVLSLSQVAAGGGLRLWDQPFDGHDDPFLATLSDPITVPYAPGALVLFDSYRLHQIEPFAGQVARISATCHVANLAGRWDVWF